MNVLRFADALQVLYRWVASNRLKFLAAVVKGRGDDVAPTLNPQAGAMLHCMLWQKFITAQASLPAQFRVYFGI